jgi:hypothetical protein
LFLAAVVDEEDEVLLLYGEGKLMWATGQDAVVVWDFWFLKVFQ